LLILGFWGTLKSPKMSMCRSSITNGSSSGSRTTRKNRSRLLSKFWLTHQLMKCTDKAKLFFIDAFSRFSLVSWKRVGHMGSAADRFLGKRNTHFRQWDKFHCRTSVASLRRQKAKCNNFWCSDAE
jgi:hypothetical protein